MLECDCVRLNVLVCASARACTVLILWTGTKQLQKKTKNPYFQQSSIGRSFFFFFFKRLKRAKRFCSEYTRESDYRYSCTGWTGRDRATHKFIHFTTFSIFQLSSVVVSWHCEEIRKRPLANELPELCPAIISITCVVCGQSRRADPAPH